MVCQNDSSRIIRSPEPASLAKCQTLHNAGSGKKCKCHDALLLQFRWNVVCTSESQHGGGWSHALAFVCTSAIWPTSARCASSTLSAHVFTHSLLKARSEPSRQCFVSPYRLRNIAHCCEAAKPNAQSSREEQTAEASLPPVAVARTTVHAAGSARNDVSQAVMLAQGWTCWGRSPAFD